MSEFTKADEGFLKHNEQTNDALNSSKKLNILAIYSEITKSTVLGRHDKSQITGCAPVVSSLIREMVEISLTIVARMGPEPILKALITCPGFDIVIAGRVYDSAPYTAYCAYQACNGHQQTLYPWTETLSAALPTWTRSWNAEGFALNPKVEVPVR